MTRLTLTASLVAMALVILWPRIAGATAEPPERQRLLGLFKNVQDVLLTINAEIIQYRERFADLSRKLQDARLWSGPSLEEDKLLPHLRGLNRLKLAVSMIGTGLEAKYAQIKKFQAELKDRYPHLVMEIDYHYNLFDKVYDDSRERHRRLSRDMDELRNWFRTRVADRNRRRDETEYSVRPFRRRHLRQESIAPELGHPSR